MRSRVRRFGRPLYDGWLTFEQNLGVLGPAHRWWRSHSVHENRDVWNAWDWSGGGEEWNESPEWKQALIEDVLERWLSPGGVVLEIGPGGGRWTGHLSSLASRLIVADVSERALELCRERFRHETNIEYVWTSGTELQAIAVSSVDAVWSFDVFVHIAPRDQAAYLAEIARVLKPGGLAVVHHADGRNRGSAPSALGWRSPMSRKLFGTLAAKRGFQIECQLDSWGPNGRYGLSGFADAITVLRHP